MKYAQPFDARHVSWSTAGNDDNDAWLDPMANRPGTTTWGHGACYGRYGIANAAMKAPIYEA